MGHVSNAVFLEAGTPAYRRANLAMFLGGFSTFSMLYGPQSLLPLFAAYYQVNPATASLILSASTGALALMLIPCSLLSDRWGRGTLMKFSLFFSAFFMVLMPLTQTLPQLLVLRIFLGISIAGLPATAMAWLGEEVAPNARGRAMGLYIAGNAFGGMTGRFLESFCAQWGGWQTAFLVSGALGLLAAWVFWRNVPPSRNFAPHVRSVRRVFADLGNLWRDLGLRFLFLFAFVMMGVFIALYNYFGFRLESPEYGLDSTVVSAIFGLYVLGTWASAWAGRLVDRIGRRHVLWRMVLMMGAGLTLTLFHSLWLIVLGVALWTVGFFGSHSTASGWVGERSGRLRALASAVYLTCYYLGGSVLGSVAGVAGVAWGWGQWLAVSMVLGAGVIGLFVTSLFLRQMAPRV